VVFAAISVVDVYASERERFAEHRQLPRRVCQIHDEHFGFNGMKALFLQHRFTAWGIARHKSNNALLHVVQNRDIFNVNAAFGQRSADRGETPGLILDGNGDLPLNGELHSAGRRTKATITPCTLSSCSGTSVG
jgi:hypothetical protein